MKGITTLILLFLYLPFGFAQSNDKSGIVFEWYSQAFEMHKLFYQQDSLHAEYLFPDTSICILDSNGLRKPGIHAIGVELEPFSDLFTIYSNSFLYPIQHYYSYYLDTIRIHGIYHRTLDSSIVDTLVFQYQRNPDTIYSLSSSLYPWIFQEYFNHSLDYHPLSHDPYSVFSTDSGVYTLKIPLRVSDRTTTLNDPDKAGFFDAGIACGFWLVDGSRLQVRASFIPGYSWNQQDTLNLKNHFRFLSYEEGQGILPFHEDGEFGMSYILDSEHLFKSLSPFTYMPTYAFPPSYAYEHHAMEFLLSSGYIDWGPPPDTIKASYEARTSTIGGLHYDSITISDSSWIDISHFCGDMIIHIDSNPSHLQRISKLRMYDLPSHSLKHELTIIQEGIVGMDNATIALQDFHLYPNPAHQEVNIDFVLSMATHVQLEVIDLRGWIVWSEDHSQLTSGRNSLRIDVSTFDSGMYIIRLRTPDSDHTERFIRH